MSTQQPQQQQHQHPTQQEQQQPAESVPEHPDSELPPSIELSQSMLMVKRTPPSEPRVVEPIPLEVEQEVNEQAEVERKEDQVASELSGNDAESETDELLSKSPESSSQTTE